MSKYIGTILTGKLFKKKYIDNVFVKLTNIFEIHNGFQYRTGLNVDFIRFNPVDSCMQGGLYFTDFDKMDMWINNNDSDNDHYKEMYYCRKVTIPDEALVYIEDNKFKADQFILGSKIPIEDLNFKDLCLEENGFASLPAPRQVIGCKSLRDCMPAFTKTRHSASCDLPVKEEQTNEICVTTTINYSYKTQNGC